MIAVPAFLWRLSNGPVALDFLTPYIEGGLTAKDGSLRVRLDTTVLALGGAERMLEIHAYNVRAYVGEGGQPIASVPDMGLSLSGRALLQGVIAPHSIRLHGAKVRLVRGTDGQILWGIGSATAEEDQAPADAGAVVAAIKDAMLGAPDSAKPGRALQILSIRNADLMVEDQGRGTAWHAPGVGLEIRRVADGVTARGSASLELSGEAGEIRLEAAYHKADGSLDAGLRLGGIRPAVFASFGGPFAHLGVIDMPLAGSVTLRLGGGGAVERLGFDLSGGAGTLDLPEPFLTRHKVASAALRGEISRDLSRIDLAEARIDLGGPVFTLAAVVDGLGGETSVKADGGFREVPVDQVKDLWPNGLAQNARDWVIPNISKGMLREGSITLSARSASGKFDDVVLDHLSGQMQAEGASVDYLRPMPPARNVAASCTFDAESFRIALKAGDVYGLRLKEGLVVLSGLDKEDQFADIDLSINGPATDALKLIDNPPLRYARALGIEPAKVGGAALARVRLKFPLLKDLRLDDIGIKASATVKGVRIPSVMMGLDLDDGILSLDVDAKGLDASGPIVLAGIPANLVWRENFSAKNQPFRSRYQLKAPEVPEDKRKLLGLDGPPFVAPFIAGPVAADVVASFSDGGKGEIDARIDLTAASMQLPGLGWSKPPGKVGSAEALVKLDHRLVGSVPGFAVKAGDLDVLGSASFVEGRARKVELNRLVYGRTNGEATLSLRSDKGGGMDVVFKGASFDAEPAITRDEAQKRGEKSDKPPPMSVNATAKSLWVSGKGALSNASVTMQRDAEEWQNISLKGGLPGGKTFSAAIAPGGPKRRNFQISSGDAGTVLRTFDVYDDLTGGELSVEGHIDDSKPEQPFIGTARISDYHIRNAPALARLLTVIAMAGIVDVLQGEGVGFSSLEAPFVLSEGLLDIRDGRAWGPALGLTAKGQVDMDRSQMALEGTVVPAYVLNSVLGNIPVLGWLITGGDKGGGLVAFNYSMKGPTNDPSVMVNPLSALTPGFLRKLFNIFDDGSATDARKGAEKPAAK
ncbi:YhdP family protein [Paramagnetospirillum marisnigri]|uniref:YhdP family protein n=1 Tax=Paramagnetospirillum marisnigri TaxID=1285242 RepID=UPI001FE0725D|nr:AsmA-like C-terminal domain-containing protein [Paramagnetospirillum marisnigri]